MSSPSTESGPYVGAMMRIIWNWVREEMYARVVEAGFDDLNPAHVLMFRSPSLDGMRPSELAAQRQISKQSVNDLVRDLEQRGYLVRERDPLDGRARVVRLTNKGRALEKAINQQAIAAERHIASKLGPRRFAELRAALEELSRDLVDGSHDRAPNG